MSIKNLFYIVKRMFIRSYKSDVELYILSKNPKTAADIEHWLMQYNYNKKW